MTDGLPWAKVASDLGQDPKVRRLERRLPYRDFLACMGAWLLVVTDAWRVGDRLGGVSAGDLDVDGDLRSSLEEVGLLDGSGRVPVVAWEKWAAVAIEEVARRAEERVRISSLGGKSRAAKAPRDGGRFLPAAPQPSAGDPPAAPQPSAGPAPAVHQPTPAKIEREKEREKETTVPVLREGPGGILLTRNQLEQWRAWDEESSRSSHPRLWEPVKRAWLGRGLRHPPTPKQRAILWEVLDSRPLDLPRWIRETPPEIRTGTDVIARVLQGWHRVKDTVRSEEIPGPPKAMASLREILERAGVPT